MKIFLFLNHIITKKCLSYHEYVYITKLICTYVNICAYVRRYILCLSADINIYMCKYIYIRIYDHQNNDYISSNQSQTNLLCIR